MTSSNTLTPVDAARRLIQTISKPATILVAVSGGSDSTGLLVALSEAAAEVSDVSIQAVTIDHRLRAESAGEAVDVGALCARLGMPHHIRSWDDSKPKTGVSAASRAARYRLIGEVADVISATAIVTAHTREDQIETITMSAARSMRNDNAGLSGMSDAMLYAGRHWVLRPFLSCRRQDIRDFLSAKGLGWVEDPSNRDRKYERVRTRMTLAEGQGSVVPAFGHGDNRGALSRQAAQLLLDHVTGHAGSVVFFGTEGLREDPAVLRLALSALAAALGGRPFLPASDSMDRIMTFVRGGMPGRMTVARTVLDLRRDGLYLTRENRDLPVVHMSAGENVIWDNRYDVTNRSGETIIARGSVEAMSLDAQRRFPGVPKGVALRAMRSDIMVSKANGVLDAPLSSIAVTRVVAPFDLFLSRFDLELACAVAELLGRSAYPQPPV